MNVCGFAGSPRKQANSDIFVDRFLDVAVTAQAETLMWDSCSSLSKLARGVNEHLLIEIPCCMLNYNEVLP